MTRTEIKKELKDLIIFDYSVLDEIAKIFTSLDDVLKTYTSSTCDLQTLEDCKIQVGSQLVYLSKLFGEVKKFKGSNHTYLEDTRKRIKSMTIEDMSGNISSKKEKVYNQDSFIRKLNALQELKKQFITIEEIFKSYERLFNSIVQSISKETKQFQGV